MRGPDHTVGNLLVAAQGLRVRHLSRNTGSATTTRGPDRSAGNLCRSCKLVLALLAMEAWIRSLKHFYVNTVFSQLLTTLLHHLPVRHFAYLPHRLLRTTWLLHDRQRLRRTPTIWKLLKMTKCQHCYQYKTQILRPCLLAFKHQHHHHLRHLSGW